MNQKFKKSFAILAAMTSLGTFSATPAFANENFTDESQTNHVTIYRLYNPNTGEHFYTADDVEKDALSMFYGWKYEGVGWYAPEQSNTPVYRLNNPNTGDHHFTPSQTERNHLIKVGWKDEGIGWYSDDAKTEAIFRQYNPNAKVGTHNYSTNIDEHYGLVRMGWKDEGIGWFALQEGVPISPENPELQLPPNEKGHFEQVWIEGKTEQVPIYEEKIFWICNRCNQKLPDGTMGEHMKRHILNGETENVSSYSIHEKVVVGYNTVQTPGHYEWQWVAD